MSLSRILPIANLVGCLLITGIIVAQWLKERGLDSKIHGLNQQLVATRDQYDAEKKHTAALESDVAQLKESIESTVKSRKETEDALAKLIAERDAQAAASATTLNQANQEQVKIWEKAIADRDGKIRDLSASLTATRARLDDAVENLKAAGAR
ncbi:MAG: hypothetical protein ABIT37_24180 [Luteolibacter sp.]